jgi:hypothetical protein
MTPRTLKRRLARRRRPDSDAFQVDADPIEVSQAALDAARAIRGIDQPPSIFIVGVMPRSGTVHVGELLRLHPDIFAYPNELWEIPFLSQVPGIRAVGDGFIGGYRQNADRMHAGDFLPLFGAALIAYLRSFGGDGRRILDKEPRANHLGRFPLVFPCEQLLLLLRDGRDVVQSTIRTWPGVRFEDACARWQLSARAMLDYHARFGDLAPACWLTRFETALADPAAFVREACSRFGLDATRYPFERQSAVDVIGSSTISQAGQVDWSKHVAPPADFKPGGAWRDWSTTQLRTFKRVAGATLVDAGYADGRDW